MVYMELNQKVVISSCVKYCVCTIYSIIETPGECTPCSRWFASSCMCGNATRQWACRSSQTISLFQIAIPKGKGWSHEFFIRSFEFSAGQLQHTWLQQARLLIEKCVTACKLFYSSL